MVRHQPGIMIASAAAYSTMDKIVIWAVGVDTIRSCENALIQALKELGLKKEIVINSESPLISRNRLWGQLPALEIRGQYWSLPTSEPFSKEQLVRLFTTVFISEEKTESNRRYSMAGEIDITDHNFRGSLDNATGVVLFHKKLCPNCKALEKMLEKFYKANPEVQYWRIDSEDCPEAMKEFDVERVPTLLVMKEGEVAAKKVGLMNVRQMNDFYCEAM